MIPPDCSRSRSLTPRRWARDEALTVSSEAAWMSYWSPVTCHQGDEPVLLTRGLAGSVLCHPLCPWVGEGPVPEPRASRPGTRGPRSCGICSVRVLGVCCFLRDGRGAARPPLHPTDPHGRRGPCGRPAASTCSSAGGGAPGAGGGSLRAQGELLLDPGLSDSLISVAGGQA